MKTITQVAKLALAMFLLGCVAHGQTQHDLTLKVSDDTGRPLAGAQATIKFLKIGGEDVNSGPTDEKGEFSARTEMSLGTFLRAEKTGHYTAQLDNTGNFQIPQGTATVPLVLPRVIKPVALHAARVSSIKLPAQGEWLGYDLAAADWVPPHGKGKTADLRFKYSKEFTGWKYSDAEMAESRRINKDQTEEQIRAYYGKWRGVLEVSFPGPKEGVAEETARYWYYNEMRLPHSAPEEGYKPSLRYEANTYEPRQPEKLVGYYLRTRVRLDADGDIISANYAKIYGDLRFDARGTVSFWYYFNPTPNDRNLEFDPARNLFPQSMKGANVANP
ncbi:hypothetical protein ASA1KI_01900 [Opitutales bacterium ASA1]|uniref:carboxypeptidase-like regulatory domain-containing protein n=1 Tax=Congregicoccus parvus TaxID=3081749 RepID=UPI002B28629C|nr:hypothetical protein ASA1KI_01900 [Opitutales bacterium ASA1]